MTKIHKLSGIVDVGGFQYEWELRSEPQWSEREGWKGMTVALLRKHTQRGALLEFPAPKRLMKGMQRGRLQIGDAIESGAFRQRYKPAGSLLLGESRWFSKSMLMATSLRPPGGAGLLRGHSSFGRRWP